MSLSRLFMLVLRDTCALKICPLILTWVFPFLVLVCVRIILGLAPLCIVLLCFGGMSLFVVGVLGFWKTLGSSIPLASA